MDEITVFISYSHDSDEHRKKVLALSERLRADGINTLLDQYLNGSPKQGWPRWMLDQLDAANCVLVICTETYYRRFRGHEVPGKGKGVDWEGALITQEMYDSRRQTLKFIPVFLSPVNEAWIPEPLRAVTYYALNSEAAYQSLYDFLLGQAGIKPRPLGELKKRTRRQGEVLTFEQASAPNQQASPILPTEFIDDRVKQAAVILDRARAENLLTMELLVKTLDRLFSRSTFREEPSIGLCVTQEWDYRLHAAAQTLHLFREYDQLVETEAPHLLQLYRELIVNVSQYCDRMAVYLFDPPVGFRELRPLVGKDEFVKAINARRKSFVGGADPATCARIDPFLKNAIDEMKKLRDEVVSLKESSRATSAKGSTSRAQRTTFANPRFHSFRWISRRGATTQRFIHP